MEQCGNEKILLKFGKSYTCTYTLLIEVYGDVFLSHTKDMSGLKDLKGDEK